MSGSPHFYAHHSHDFETRRSVTGVLKFINKTPIPWYSRRQNTVETLTYWSDLLVVIISMEFPTSMPYKIRIRMVPIDGPAWILGDNDSVMTSLSIPYRTIKNNHNGIAYSNSTCMILIYFMCMYQVYILYYMGSFCKYIGPNISISCCTLF